MKRVFQVTIYLHDGSHNEYKVISEDDLQARSKVENMEIQSFKDFGNLRYPGTSYCETKMICELDG